MKRRGGSLGAGMEAEVDGFEALLLDVSVDLGGGDVGVAEQFLDNTQIRSVLEQVGCKGVPQEVGVDVLRESGPLGGLLGELPDPIGGKGPASNGEKNMAAGNLADESGTFDAKVTLH